MNSSSLVVTFTTIDELPEGYGAVCIQIWAWSNVAGGTHGGCIPGRQMAGNLKLARNISMR